MEKTVYVVGHRNPDTDSVVAASAYAQLHWLCGDSNYVPVRAGKLAPQTEYIFYRFKIPAPEYLPDVIPKAAYYMAHEFVCVNQDEPLWTAMAVMEENGTKALTVVDNDGSYQALLHYNAFVAHVLSVLNPEKAAAVSTSVPLLCKTMNGQLLTAAHEDKVFKCCVLVASEDLESFESDLIAHASENIIVVIGKRPHSMELSLKHKAKVIITVNGFVVSKETRKTAEQNGVAIISSPYDTSTTVSLVTYSTPVSAMADRCTKPVKAMDTLQKIRPLLQKSPSRSLPVVDSKNKVIGTISESDLLREPNIELVLVDHNELSQAIEGASHYTVREIIDHHRLGAISTRQPVTFINKPLGSTCTIVTGLYREKHISIPKSVASILLCGILSDTLALRSATTTDIDRETAQYLSNITDLDVETLGMEIVSASSKISGRSAEDVVHQDIKEYTEGAYRFAVSQIEVNGTDEFMRRKDEFMQELDTERASRGALFCALLVTDITKLSSIMLISCDKRFAPLTAGFQQLEENVFYLKDIVSRKKQLIPLLTELLGTMEA